ncbi:MAG: nuclear transport factor 2 family protein [Gemmataceae bacterium]|nr:nuclear transport factor 2 family protein [Gemmataceae bacterium]
MSRYGKRLLAAGLVVVGVGAVFAADDKAAPKGDDEKAIAEVKKRGDEWDAALKGNDPKAVAKLLDAAGRFITADGRELDKAGFAADDAAQKIVYESVASSETTYRAVGGVVIETGAWTGTGTKDGKPFRQSVRYTTVWVKKNGVWVVTADQATPTAEKK